MSEQELELGKQALRKLAEAEVPSDKSLELLEWLRGKAVWQVVERIAKAEASLHFECPICGLKFAFHEQRQVDMLLILHVKTHALDIDRVTTERDQLKADNDRLNDALNQIGEKEFANSGYNLPQMVRVIDLNIKQRDEIVLLKAQLVRMRAPVSDEELQQAQASAPSTERMSQRLNRIIAARAEKEEQQG